MPGIDHIPTDEDWQSLVHKAKELETRIHSVQGKQNDYNAVLERCYVVEEAQRVRMQELRDQVREDEVHSLTNPTFANWIKSQEETMATENDVIGTWFNEERLLSLTPFAAVVPFPRYLTARGSQMCERAIDQFNLVNIYAQTVPVKSSVMTVCQAMVPQSDHLLAEVRASKSDLGPLSYVAVSHSSGADVMRMIDANTILREALKDTSCLLINDRRVTAALCVKALVVRGRCALAEVGCTRSCLPIFDRPTGDVEDGRLTPLDVLSYAFGNYIKTALTPVLKTRTYEAMFLGYINGVGSAEAAGAEFFQTMTMKDITFHLVNMDYPDNSHFDMFSEDDIRSISGYVSRRDHQGRVELPPAMRLVVPSGPHPQSSTVAMAIRQMEKSADRYKAAFGSPAPAAVPGSPAPAAAATPVAAHIDPFMHVRPDVMPTASLVPTSGKFFSELDSIEKLLGAGDRNNTPL